MKVTLRHTAVADVLLSTWLVRGRQRAVKADVGRGKTRGLALLALVLLFATLLSGSSPLRVSTAAAQDLGELAEAGTWTPVSMIDAPAARTSATAVWTGASVIVWGGLNVLGTPPCVQLLCPDGGAYDPVAATWQSVPSTTPRAAHSAVWTGNDLIVFGGRRTISFLPGGAAFNPASNEWRQLSSANSPGARAQHAAAWTGSSMLIWGGIGCPGDACADGAAYDPTTDTWRTLQARGAPGGRFDMASVWTGSEFILWGGNGGASVGLLGDGAAYSPATDTWRPLSLIGAPHARSGAVAVWTGLEMLVWGGECGEPAGACADGAAYKPSTDTWRPLGSAGAPSPRLLAASAWTGSDLLVWGGEGCGAAGACQDGADYNPTTDVWTPLPLAGAPGARIEPASVWTDHGMFVWGGHAASGIALDDGAIFTPAGLPLPSTPASSGASK